MAVLLRSRGMQNPPSPDPLAKFRTSCCPPVELVKLSKDVGSCTVEIKMARVQLGCSEFRVTKPPLRGYSLLLLTACT